MVIFWFFGKKKLVVGNEVWWSEKFTQYYNEEGTKQISFFENLEILKKTTSKTKRLNQQLP